jgi:nitrate/nitrite-specific signal transduction histidine kinase
LFRLGGSGWPLERQRGELLASAVLRAGLLRARSARTLAQIASASSSSPSLAWHHERLHHEFRRPQLRSANAATRIASVALRICHR